MRGEDADFAAEQFRSIGEGDQRRVGIATDAGRIGKARRWPFRHVQLEDVGHCFFIIEGPAERRVDIGQVRFREMVRCRDRFVFALGGEVGFEERRHLRRGMRGIDDFRVKRFGAQARRHQQRHGGGSKRCGKFQCNVFHSILPRCV
jgi:hypothetical protein